MPSVPALSPPTQTAPTQATGMTGVASVTAASPRWLHNPVLLLLLVLGAAAAATASFLSVAPNRLLSGQGLRLAQLQLGGWAGWPGWIAVALPTALLVLAAVLPNRRRYHALAALAAAALLVGLLALAGAQAKSLASSQGALTRVVLGGGFWCLAAIAWLTATNALQRLRLGPTTSVLAQIALWLPVAVLVLVLGRSGGLDALSLLNELSNRQDVFSAACLRHGLIVLAALGPALLLGLPLGLAAARRPGLARPLLALLGAVQTVPSIALFGLLIAPLAWAGSRWPGWGLQGVGLLPAAIALALYALLPIVHGVLAGLQQVPANVLDAATGLGLSPRQRFRQVQLPLALPVWLSALRVALVQTVGLAVVAALIGAGGLGALVFQGLASSALDLVLLGVLPVVALALLLDATLRVITHLANQAAAPSTTTPPTPPAKPSP